MFQLQKHLTKLKKLNKYEYWKNIGSQAMQDITQRIEKGYQLFFDYLKNRKKEKVSPPNFKKIFYPKKVE